ncbi:MAG: histidine phosphatase family protein [Eubacterium sp.]|nr:histidine phosphatase family protein [Eubacterium sp.]
MEIWIARHAEPDYEHDSITEKGEREAKLLAQRLSKQSFAAVYCSPMGRAQKTVSYTLEKIKMKPTVYDWLHEFRGNVILDGEITHCWDRKPSYWCNIYDYYSYDKWLDVDLMQSDNVPQRYEEVCKGIDELLEKHGYIHNGRTYDVVKPNKDKILLFCHFGVEAVILSHIFGISPMPLWHNFVALPSTVTRIVSEEREEGTATFRCMYFGDVSHLYAGNEEPAFAARFCEVFTDDTRH